MKITIILFVSTALLLGSCFGSSSANSESSENMVVLDALKKNDIKRFLQLLESGFDPNNIVSEGESVVGLAVIKRNPEFLRIALKCGGNPNAVNDSEGGRPILFLAVASANSDKVDMLIEFGADIDKRSSDGTTALILASNSRQMELVYKLLQLGADYRTKRNTGGDIAHGIFGPNWDESSDAYKWRKKVVHWLEDQGYTFDKELIQEYAIVNLDEATGKVTPRIPR